MLSSDAQLLIVDKLSAAWDGTNVVSDVSFTVGPREFVVLMGPNGSGKTTLLRCLAGLEPLVSGSIQLNGRSMSDVPAHQRGIGMLFQEPALFPRRTVWENIAYGPQLQRLPPVEVATEVEAISQLLHLDLLLDRSPHELSGGERQRVALARTVAARPALVLLDEPFASIDVEIKAELRTEFRRVLRALGIAALHVTHDREEGLYLGDRVLLLQQGRLQQSGTPRDVFDHPVNASVARFLGYNILQQGSSTLAIDPRDVLLDEASGAQFRAEVIASGFAGDGVLVHLRTVDGRRIEARRLATRPIPVAGQSVGVSWQRSVRLTT